MKNEVNILDWDSRFFSLKIASLSLFISDDSYVEQSLLKLKNEDFDLVYLYATNEVEVSSQLYSFYNIKQVDNKCIFETSIDAYVSLEQYISIFKGEPDCLYKLAIQAGKDSRYNMDTYFSKGEFERLYKTWIDNSLKGELADDILVYEKDGTILGFITLKKHENKVSIGLIATDFSCRRIGVGTSLLNAAKGYTAKAGKEILEVVTQGHNLTACAFYKKNGFFLKSQTQIFHIWLKK